MLRPRWIGALVFALAFAAVFAGLGQWQLERAIESGKAVEAPTETVLPLPRVAQPGGPIRDTAVGQLVEVTGTFVPGDEQLLSDRLNHGVSGFWVVSHATVELPGGETAALAVPRGWAPDEAAAQAAAGRLAQEPAPRQPIVGRILPDEQPEAPADKSKPTAMRTLGVGALYNLWHGVDGRAVYSAYLVDRTPPAGLAAIDSPPPIAQTELNWLNVFYAAEWIIFAGFSIFLWYRLPKDAKEREDELRGLAAAEDPDAQDPDAQAGAAGAVAAGKVD